MSRAIQAIRGMNDILPLQTEYWCHLEDILRQIVVSYGYQEIRFPILEKTRLFQRTIGEVTDIVEKAGSRFTSIKEINQLDGVRITFEDNSWLLIRPSGTEPVLRITIEATSEERVSKIQKEVKNLLAISTI